MHKFISKTMENHYWKASLILLLQSVHATPVSQSIQVGVFYSLKEKYMQVAIKI